MNLAERSPQDGQLLAAILEHSSDVVVVIDVEGKLSYVSPSAPALFGFPHGTHLGANVFQLVHPDDVAGARAAFAQRKATNTRREPFEVRVAHADGGWRFVELVANNLTADPAVNGIVLTLRDITERRRAEHALRESEERLNALLRYSSDIIVVTDADGMLQIISPAAERMLGFAIPAWVGRGVLDLVHPDDREQVHESLLSTSTTPGLNVPIELRITNADGTWRHVEVVANNLLHLPAVTGIVFNVRDITDRLQAEAALDESERRYRTIVELAHEGIWTIDADGVTTYANDQMGELLGRTSAEMVGVHIFEYMDDEGRVIAEENLERRRAGVKENHDFKFLRREGLPVWTMMSTSPILADDGEYLGAIALVTDVTERRQIEATLREAELDGQRREAELERTLLEAELSRSQRLESLGRLAGGVAHDFNNLLGVILNYAGFVTKQLDPADPIAADVAEIRRAAERASDLTRQLLLFGRREIINATRFDLNAVIDAATPMLRRMLGELDLVVQLTSEPTTVDADRGQIEQALMNLIINSRDATPDRGTITIRTRSCVPLDGSPTDALVELSVSDDGAGMARDVVEQAFEPFFTTKSRDRGSGLGLASVHGIVARAGGDVRIDSRQGVGTRVTVTLPSADPVLPAGPTLVGAKVLVVDDEPEVRTVTARILREHGYQVVEARCGNDALASIGAEASDVALVVSDVVMPGMSGPQLVEKVTALRPTIGVVLMSGYAHDEVRNSEPAHTTLLAKPFTEDQLLTTVEQALRAGVMT